MRTHLDNWKFSKTSNISELIKIYYWQSGKSVNVGKNYGLHFDYVQYLSFFSSSSDVDASCSYNSFSVKFSASISFG